MTDRPIRAACGAKRCQGHVFDPDGPTPLELPAEIEDERPSEADIRRAVEIPRTRGEEVGMKRPRIDLRCSCSGEMVGTISPASKAPTMRDIFLSVHSEPGCIVTDHSAMSKPAPPETDKEARRCTPG
jgi:hypothetical protein